MGSGDKLRPFRIAGSALFLEVLAVFLVASYLGLCSLVDVYFSQGLSLSPNLRSRSLSCSMPARWPVQPTVAGHVEILRLLFSTLTTLLMHLALQSCRDSPSTGTEIPTTRI